MLPPRPISRRSAGFTLIELVVAAGILAVLALAIVPVAQVSATRAKEVELRRHLRTMRLAIDAYRAAADEGKIAESFMEPDHHHYPPTLETLVDGVPASASDEEGTSPVLRFLRRIPLDPMTGRADWRLRSYQDPPDVAGRAGLAGWGGQNVFDVRSTSRAEALDGTRYADW